MELFMEIDGMRVMHGELARTALCDEVPFRIDRDRADGGVDFAQGTMPTCVVKESEGFSESELRDLESLMRDNMPLIYDKIRGVGVFA